MYVPEKATIQQTLFIHNQWTWYVRQLPVIVVNTILTVEMEMDPPQLHFDTDYSIFILNDNCRLVIRKCLSNGIWNSKY